MNGTPPPAGAPSSSYRRYLLLALIPVLFGVTLFLVLRPDRAFPPRSTPVPPTATPLHFGRLSTPPPTTPSPVLPALLDDGRLFYEPGWGSLEVRRYLEGRPGTLAGLSLWIGDTEMPMADIISGKCLLYGLNPKVVLALLEFQSGLIDAPEPSPDALAWAMGRRHWEDEGLEPQIDWAVRELFRATRDFPLAKELVLSDGSTVPIPPGTNLGSYALMRVVALAGGASDIQRLLGPGPSSFTAVYRRLFGEDPRQPLADLPSPAEHPFLAQPYEGTFEVTSIFDHQGPFLSEDGSLISYLGEEASGLPYDGHDGWDYALDAGVPILAAADGVVAWAGNSNDRCATIARGVILDHGNGYQTLYWHLDTVTVDIGQRVRQGERIGTAGATGCADGPHLHFGVHFLGRETDPEGWCGLQDDPWALHPAGTGSRWLWADRLSPCQWPAEAIVVDDGGPGFFRSGSPWYDGQGGVGGHAYWVPATYGAGSPPTYPAQLDASVQAAVWRPELPAAGRYQVYAFVPYWNNATPDTHLAHYWVHHA
ncbi:MAG: peptidoglycan DD-metalloendopeptidase family protein, partial [Chloroflexia bacterium]